MAYEVDNDAILQVTFDMRQDGQQIMNVFNYRLVCDVPVEGLAAIVVARDAIDGSFGSMWDKYLACLNEDVIQGRILLQWITPVRYSAYVHVPVARAGAKEGTPLPCNCCAVIQRNADGATRHDRSISHIGGLTAGDVSDSIVQDAHRNLLQEFVESSLSEIAAGLGALLVPVAFNRELPQTSPQLRLGLTRDTSRVMRRRTVRVGS